MGAVNGAVLALIAVWFIAMTVLAISESPTWEDVE